MALPLPDRVPPAVDAELGPVQHLVDGVGDALQVLVRVGQRLLGDPHLGHVDQDAVGQQAAGGVRSRTRALVDVADALGDLEPEHAVDRGAARQLQVALLDEHPVVRVHGGHEPAGHRARRRAIRAGDALPARTDVRHLPRRRPVLVQLERVGDRGDAREHAIELAAGRRELRGQLGAVGDVADDHVGEAPSAGLLARDAPQQQPAHRAVVGDMADAGRDALAAADRVQRLAEHRQVVRVDVLLAQQAATVGVADGIDPDHGAVGEHLERHDHVVQLAQHALQPVPGAGQLPLGRAPVGDVDAHPGHGAAAGRREPVPDLARLAVGPHDPVLDLARLTPRRALAGLGERRSVVRVDGARPGRGAVRLAQQLRGTRSGHVPAPGAVRMQARRSTARCRWRRRCGPATWSPRAGPAAPRATPSARRAPTPAAPTGRRPR